MRPFNFYLENNKVVKQEKNIETAKSIIQNAKTRWDYYKNAKIEEWNANILFEAYYEVVREIIQSELAKEGYKPYSHEAIVSFANERKILDIGDIIKLDRFRISRHDSMYYGKKVSAEDAIQIKELSEKLVKRCFK